VQLIGIRGEIAICRIRQPGAEPTQAGYGVLGLVSTLIRFVPTRHGTEEPFVAAGFHHRCQTNKRPLRPGTAAGSAARKGCAVAAQSSGKAAPTYPSYLHTAEVADLLHVSPKTVSRWAKEGKLPFLKTLGGHRRYPEAEIRDLAKRLREQATA
jgi:excisionase family DNA binding protein